MSSAGKGVAPIHDLRRKNDKQEPKRWGKFVPKNDNKESMNIDVSPVKVTTKVSKNQSVKTTSGARPNQKTLKEMQ